jgi:hypothetical protein
MAGFLDSGIAVKEDRCSLHHGDFDALKFITHVSPHDFSISVSAPA